MKEYSSILGQRTLSESTTLRCGSSSCTCLKRSDTTSADSLHTTLCSYGSGSAMTMCGGVIRSPVAGQSGQIPVPCWPHLPNPRLATSCLYQKWSCPTTLVFWNDRPERLVRHVARIVKTRRQTGRAPPPLPSIPLPCPPFPFPSLPLEVGPLN